MMQEAGQNFDTLACHAPTHVFCTALARDTPIPDNDVENQKAETPLGAGAWRRRPWD
jgi:hypothetical protein